MRPHLSRSWRTATALVGGVVALALPACGASGAGVDAKQLEAGLTQGQFGQPITLRFQATHAGYVLDARLGNQAPALTPPCMAALLVKHGGMTLGPRARGGYSVSSPYGSLSDQALWAPFEIPLGTRHVVGHSDRKAWTESGRQRFAETIQYKIALNPLVAGDWQSIGGFQTRIAWVNDPALGAWRIADDTPRFPGGSLVDKSFEYHQVAGYLAGQCDVGSFPAGR